jgi:hypothetical protein
MIDLFFDKQKYLIFDMSSKGLCSCPCAYEKAFDPQDGGCLTDRGDYIKKIEQQLGSTSTNKEKRFAVYRFAASRFGYLDYRTKLPPCVVSDIRDRFPEEN